jgi:hypothetical protein
MIKIESLGNAGTNKETPVAVQFTFERKSSYKKESPIRETKPMMYFSINL